MADSGNDTTRIDTPTAADMTSPVGRIISAARAMMAIGPALHDVTECPEELAAAHAATERGYFSTAETAAVRAWFARYLTLRGALLEVVHELRRYAYRLDVDELTRRRSFLLSYTAACLVVRAARFLVDEFATSSIVQRKLNEACASHRIPRRQYTHIYRSLTRPINAWRLHHAHEHAIAHWDDLMTLAEDAIVGPVVEVLRSVPDALDVPPRRYLMALGRFRWHSLRRRRATAWQQVSFDIAKASGRLIAELRSPWHPHRVTKGVQRRIEALLRPGDVIITRYHHALSNLFLPGYWPHASLHIGSTADRTRLGVMADDDRRARWVDPARILEARKDGVLFRPLHDTLAVDAVAVIRPRLSEPVISEALSRAVTHEGKLYNFDFDFFGDDKLVCTEVIYRAYEGVGGEPIPFRLTRRAGRVTLSAGDLIRMATKDMGFNPVAVFGAPTCRRRIVTGEQAREALQRTCEPG